MSETASADNILAAGQGIANYGFPIVVSWYLLSRMETKLDALSKNIDALSHTIDSLMR